MCRNEAGNEHENADSERTATNPKKFIEVTLKNARSIGKISAEGFAQLPRRSRLGVTVGEMDDNSDRLIDG